jgi:murein DD-endopeptidase MepM/ murein hydrolase activator NlpD
MPSAALERSDSLAARLLPDRQLLLRGDDGYRPLTITTRTQVLVFLALYLSAAAATFAITGFLSGRAQLAEATQRLAELRQAADSGQRSRGSSEERLRQMIADLERTGADQRTTIDSLGELKAVLEHELAQAREELGAVTAERDAARAEAFRKAALAQDQPPASSPGETPATDAGRVAALEAELAATQDERDHLRRDAAGLQWRVQMLENRLADMRESASAEAGRLREWIAKQVSSLEDVLSTSGVDVDRLIERVDTKLSSGQGGPLEPVPLDQPRTGRFVLQGLPSEELTRLRAIHALLQSMPLVAPLSLYKKNSGFGVRTDPITGRAALHPGLDFGGPYGAQVLATAPGRAVHAGPEGAYGNMVEIDHGMGIHTRYGHLRKVLVRPGDRVTLHQPVGIMGSTGRSTGEHVHYEVRIDGVAHDPAQFLEAGRELKDAFKE